MITLLSSFGDDLMVVNAARVSFAKESKKFSDKDGKLIKYLAAHGHISPFFHPQVQFRIKMPFFLAREWFRHTIGFARNEVSRRYVETPPEFFLPKYFRKKGGTNKQGSINEKHHLSSLAMNEFNAAFEKARSSYKAFLALGIPAEQARLLLPMATYTEFIETGSLYAYARLYKQRIDEGAQLEIREYAAALSVHMEKLFPVSWKALTQTKPKGEL